VEHVSHLQSAGGVPPELTEAKGGATAEVGRDVESTFDRYVAALSGSLCHAELDHVSGGDGEGLVWLDGGAIQRGSHIGTGEGEAGGVGEAQGAAYDGALEGGGIQWVADEGVCQTKVEVVKGTGGRNPYVPQPEATGVVLHGGLYARL